MLSACDSDAPAPDLDPTTDAAPTPDLGDSTGGSQGTDGNPPDAADEMDALPDDAGTPDARPPEPPPPALPARMGVAGLAAPGNVAVLAERADMEWSLLRAERRGDGALDVDAILDRVDCVVLPGGADIDPAVYGETPDPTVRLISEARAELDFAVLQGALDRRMPILGLCLGGQELNVLLGGALVQDIPSEVDGHLDHRQNHRIEIVPGTLMDSLYAVDALEIYSNHHQAAEDGPGLADGLRVAARSADGVVEAFEAEDRETFPFVFGTQYHPEQQLDTGLHDGLIAGFKAACLDYQAQHPRAAGGPDHGTVWDYGACHNDAGPGVCLDVGECADRGGVSGPGPCAGPAHIQCCSAVACVTGAGLPGECFSTDLCDQLGGARERWLCPGNSEVECCLQSVRCALRDGTPGRCEATAACDARGGRREAGLCPGPRDIQCCDG
jgi:gamma-glutamyl-gamma-aminobutyrate hydrolase PuuD